MTRHEERLAGILRRAIAGLSEEEAVKRLFELGAVSRRGCLSRPGFSAARTKRPAPIFTTNSKTET